MPDQDDYEQQDQWVGKLFLLGLALPTIGAFLGCCVVPQFMIFYTSVFLGDEGGRLFWMAIMLVFGIVGIVCGFVTFLLLVIKGHS